MAAAAAAIKANSKGKPKKSAAIGPEEDIDDGVIAAKDVIVDDGFFKYQKRVRDFYQNDMIVKTVAGLIIANFITEIAEKQWDPASKPEYAGIWLGFSYFYNICFTIELIVNMYGSWGGPMKWTFWKDSWNIFDFVVVTIGILIMAEVNLGPLKLLRMMRAFRVFRLFKRIKQLNKIITSLMKAVPGMFYAFIIMTIVMCIFANLGVEFFRGTGDIGEVQNMGPHSRRMSHADDDAFITGRGYKFGHEYFGNFFRSLYTLFQVLSGDSWSEAIARPIINENPGYALYFVIFIIVVAWVLINVVVAVLLEKMVDDGEDGAEEAEVDEDLTTDSALKYLKTEQEREFKVFRAETQKQLESIKEALKLICEHHGVPPPPTLLQKPASLTKDMMVLSDHDGDAKLDS